MTDKDWINCWVSLLMIESSKNLRWADDELNSGDSQRVYGAICIVKEIQKILEEHDKMEDLNCWSAHRKILKDWIQDILSRVDTPKKIAEKVKDE